jgi:protein SCO1/2
MKRLVPLILIVVLAGVGVWLALFWRPPASGGHAALDVPAGPRGGDFTLNSLDGPVSLADDRGKVVLLYFGYTMCPDICPTSLAMIKGAYHELTPAERDQVAGIFVSVDPQHDTLKRLAEYAGYFDPHIKGVTGTAAQVAAVAKKYGVVYRMVDEPSSALGYTIDHSAFTYVIDRHGKLRASLPHGTTPDRIAAELRKLLAEN